MTAAWAAALSVAAVSAFAASSKLLATAAASAGIAELLGLSSPRTARFVTLSAGAVETCVALLLVLQIHAGAWLAAACFAAFTGIQAWTLARRGRGVRCGCFGGRSRVDARSLTVTAALLAASLFVALRPARVAGDIAGWSVAVLAVVALAGVAAVAHELARQVGELGDGAAPGDALEILEEGPPLGASIDLPALSHNELRVAVFLSPACGLCHRLEPSIAVFGLHHELALAVYDEEDDVSIWRELEIPGSPYALALDGEGRVLAKGAFNTIAQLEGLCATALRRARLEEEMPRAAA